MADLKEIGKQAKAARYILAGLDTDTKNKALFTAAECLEADAADILAENAKDLEAGRSRSMPEGLLDRLSLTQKRISDMAEGLRQVAALQLQHAVGLVQRFLNDLIDSFDMVSGGDFRYNASVQFMDLDL